MSDLVRDGGWTLMGYNPVTKIRTWMLRLDDGRWVERKEYFGIEAVIERNKARQNASTTLSKPTGDFCRQVAEVPLSIAHDTGLITAIREKDRKHIKRFLNDADYRAFRTNHAKV